jgi:DNA-binding MarR family transcriptional regulator
VRDILEDKFVSEVSPHPLSRAQFRLLKLVALGGAPQVGEAASSLGLSAAATSKNLDALERLDLVTRSDSPHDRRATLLSPSRRGRRLVHDYEKLTEERLAPVVEELRGERLDLLCELLEKVCLDLLQWQGEQGGTCLRCAGYYQEECPVGEIQGGCPSYESNLKKSAREQAGVEPAPPQGSVR